MRFTIVIFLLAVSPLLNAAGLPWNQGIVVLKDRQVMVGEVVIQSSLDVVLFRSGGETTFLPAHKVDYAMLNDGHSAMPRKFVTREVQERTHRKAALFELIVDGPLSVIRKPKGSTLPALDDVRAYDYFVVNGTSVTGLSSFRREIMPLMRSLGDQESVNRFLHQEQLDPGRAEDILRLIGYYNEAAVTTAQK